MAEPLIWLQNLQLLTTCSQPPIGADALIAADGALLAIGEAARSEERRVGKECRL